MSTSLTALLDSSLNAYLSLDKHSQQRLDPLANKVICLHITGLNIKLYFFPDHNGIYTLTEYQGQADVTLIAAPIALMRLSRASNAGKYLLESNVKIEGNIGLSEQFSQLLSKVDLDWEEWLSYCVGDLIAYETAHTARRSRAWLSEYHQTIQNKTSEYLQTESCLLPADAEVAYYLDQVDDCRADTSRLEARLQRLHKNIASKSP
jgi:ubiquinone biosynthesis protein UbiJ